MNKRIAWMPAKRVTKKAQNNKMPQKKHIMYYHTLQTSTNTNIDTMNASHREQTFRSMNFHYSSH